MKILVTMPSGESRDTFIPQKIAEKLNTMGEIIWNESKSQFTPQQLREIIHDIDVCITGWNTCRFDDFILENAKRLKLVAHTGGTVRPFVSECFFNKGIKIISGNQFYGESVAEGTIAYILTALRDIPYCTNLVQEGKWRDKKVRSEGLFDQTVGIVGFGMVAKNLIKLLQPFRVRIKVYSEYIDEIFFEKYNVERATLEEIFSTCKIVTIHLARKPETFHLVDQKLLQVLPEGSLLVNTARGSIIDEEALADELQKGRFKAILDVFEVEPLPEQSRLRGLRNTILVPHMAGPTVDRRKLVTMGLLEDIDRFFHNKALHYEISREYASYMTQ